VRQQRAGVQDEGSQLVALALADIDVPGNPGAWLDLCSGPGGKSAILAGAAHGVGATLTAVEVNDTRARLVENALEHAPGNPRVVVADGRTFDDGTRYDRILVDAPCSGLGALRRRPEARWRKQPGDLPALVALQGQLLDHAADLVRPGGVIGYATCSPHIAETYAVVERLRKQRPGFELVNEPMLLRPDVDGTDGMFLALLRAPSGG
jgi:16S rRNA (cytosine967-C5)-methyltransferase